MLHCLNLSPGMPVQNSIILKRMHVEVVQCIPHVTLGQCILYNSIAEDSTNILYAIEN